MGGGMRELSRTISHLGLGGDYDCEREREREVTQLCLTLCDPWIVAYQAPLSMGFSRQ